LATDNAARIAEYFVSCFVDSKCIRTGTMQAQTLQARWQHDNRLDRLMNWIVGTLLVGAVALLVSLQTHPPI
jgi:hypothetical protein